MSRDRKGFTLVEALISGFILSIILAALFMVLKIGSSSRSSGSAKIDLQAKVRQIVDYIARDVRQTTAYNVGNESTTRGYNMPEHIVFQQVQSWTTASGGSLVFGDNYIEYDYDSSQEKLFRKILDASENVTWTLEFNNIVAAPFFTRDAGDAIVALNQSDLLSSGKIIIRVVADSQSRHLQNVTFTIEEEVTIRNNQ